MLAQRRWIMAATLGPSRSAGALSKCRQSCKAPKSGFWTETRLAMSALARWRRRGAARAHTAFAARWSELRLRGERCRVSCFAGPELACTLPLCRCRPPRLARPTRCECCRNRTTLADGRRPSEALAPLLERDARAPTPTSRPEAATMSLLHGRRIVSNLAIAWLVGATVALVPSSSEAIQLRWGDGAT